MKDTPRKKAEKTKASKPADEEDDGEDYIGEDMETKKTDVGVNKDKAKTDTVMDTETKENKEPGTVMEEAEENKEPEETKAEPIEKEEQEQEEEEYLEEEEEEDDEAGEESDEEMEVEEEKPKVSKKKKAAKKSKPSSPEETSNLNFHPVNNASWKKGQKIQYLYLSRVFDAVAGTTKRLTKTRLVSNFLRSVIALSPEQLVEVFYLCCNKIAPQYEGIELGIGDTILLKAVSEATGTTMKKLKEELGRIGDIGTLAQQKRNKQRTIFPPPPLKISGVFKNLLKLAKTTGHKSGTVKGDLIKKMIVSCRESEIKYIIRCLQGNLRIGLAAQTVQSSLAQAVVLTPPGGKVMDASKHMGPGELEEEIKKTDKIIKQAFIEVPNFEHVITMLLKHGIKELPKHCQLTPGIPIKAMLGKPASGISELFEKFLNVLFTIEFKYDGERAQIHLLPDGTIKIFSRNSEDNTGKYPDLIASLPEAYASGMETFIIDCEVVAWSAKDKKILPFQTLSQRKRKDVSSENIDINVVLFAFDCIYMNGKSLINEQFMERRKILRESFKEVEGKFFFAKGKDAKEPEEIEEFLKLSIESSCEGLMVKALDKDAQYVPDKRNWIKIKKDYLEGMSDSLDLVPIGAFRGKGKRAGLYGCFLLACYDPESEEYQSITKIGTGFSEDDLKKHTEFFKKHLLEAPKSYYRYDSKMECDVWFEPCQVWEVRAADLSISPVHKAAVGQLHPSKGIALRFPRFLRIRDDKDPESSTVAEQVVDMYNAQSVVQ